MRARKDSQSVDTYCVRARLCAQARLLTDVEGEGSEILLHGWSVQPVYTYLAVDMVTYLSI